MKSIQLKPMLFIAIVLTFILSACGAKAVPTVDPAQVQASAVAAANTIVAMTQAALPTQTPVPPTVAATDTPQPTPTIPALPTSPILASPTTAPASSSSGDCSYLSVSKGEKTANMLVNNKMMRRSQFPFTSTRISLEIAAIGQLKSGQIAQSLLTNLPTGMLLFRRVDPLPVNRIPKCLMQFPSVIPSRTNSPSISQFLISNLRLIKASIFIVEEVSSNDCPPLYYFFQNTLNVRTERTKLPLHVIKTAINLADIPDFRFALCRQHSKHRGHIVDNLGI